MRILLISDTHGNQTALLKTYSTVGNVDAIIHLGDGEADGALLSAIENRPVIQIAGNCDLGSTAPRELICEWKNLRLLLCHGDHYGVKSGFSRLIERGHKTGVAAVLYGHTHLARIDQHDSLWLINPGTMNHETSFRSFALLEITEKGLQASIHSCPD
jgi:uncharacterized protein